MTVLLASSLSAEELFPEAADPSGAWNRHCLLWRSAFDEQQWTDFALAVTVRRTWNEDGSERALEISFRQGAVPSPEPTDVNWLYRYPRGHGGSVWTRTYWHEVWHKMSVAGGTNDSVVRHALDPVFATLGPLITTFMPQQGERATSMAHDLMQLVVAPTTALSGDDLAALYQRLLAGALSLPRETSQQLARMLERLIERDKNLVSVHIFDVVSRMAHELASDEFMRRD